MTLRAVFAGANGAKNNAEAEDFPRRLIAWSHSVDPWDRLGSLILSGHLLAANALQAPSQDCFELQQTQLKQAAIDLTADPPLLKNKKNSQEHNRFAKQQQGFTAFLNSLNPQKLAAAVDAAASVLKERYELEPFDSEGLPGGVNRLMVNVIFWATHMQARHAELNKTPRPLPGFWELLARLGALPSPLTKP